MPKISELPKTKTIDRNATFLVTFRGRTKAITLEDLVRAVASRLTVQATPRRPR